MRNIINQYGKIVIAGIVGVVIILCFYQISLNGKEGVPKIVGDLFSKESSYFLQNNNDSSSFKEFCKRKKCQFRLREDKQIIEGEPILINDIIASNMNKPIEVYKIESVDNLGNFQNIIRGDELVFPQSGVYKLFIRSEYETGNYCYGKATVVVNGNRI